MIMPVIADHKMNEIRFDSSNVIMEINKPSKVSVLEIPLLKFNPVNF